jgi:hypothetical protein
LDDVALKPMQVQIRSPESSNGHCGSLIERFGVLARRRELSRRLWRDSILVEGANRLALRNRLPACDARRL